jgi:integrase
MLCGRPDHKTPIVPAHDSGEWSDSGFENWRRHVWTPALEAAGVDYQRHLRHSFASLLLHEGRSVIHVARQLGHSATLTIRTYRHVIEELDDAPQLAAEDAIVAARASLPILESSDESSEAEVNRSP